MLSFCHYIALMSILKYYRIVEILHFLFLNISLSPPFYLQLTVSSGFHISLLYCFLYDLRCESHTDVNVKDLKGFKQIIEKI